MGFVDFPTAAYLYVVSLDPPGLAWEYLRRNAGYRADWSRAAETIASVAAEPWGLRRPGEP